MAAWAASRHYLNLSGAEPGGDYSNDRPGRGCGGCRGWKATSRMSSNQWGIWSRGHCGTRMFRLFILAHCLEFFGSMAFLARSFRTVAGEPESIQAQALNTRRPAGTSASCLVLQP